MLSNLEFLRHRLARVHRTPPVVGAGLGPSLAEDIKHAVRHMQAQRLGRPFSYQEIRLDLCKLMDRPEKFKQHTVAFHGENLSYPRAVDGGGTELVVRDLATGNEHTYCGEAREDILCVTLHEDLLAFASFEGALYVASLRSPEPPTRLRLPSSAIAGLTSDGHGVALLVGTGTVMVYSLVTKRLTEHRFALLGIEGGSGATAVPHKLVLDYHRGTLDIFTCHTVEADRSTRPGLPDMLHVGHLRLDIGHSASRTGLLEPVASSMLQLETSKGRTQTIERITQLGVPSLYQIHLVRAQGGRMGPPRYISRQEQSMYFDASILFDARAPELSVG